MKHFVILFAIAVACGCSQAPEVKEAESQFSAEELARLMDFHVWRVKLPAGNQMVHGARLVVVDAAGKTTKLDGHGYSTKAEPWDEVVVGMRCSDGVFKGNMEAHYADTNRGRVSWQIDFTNTNLVRRRSWTGPKTSLEGNLATLATFVKPGATNFYDDSAELRMAVQLLREIPRD